MGMSSASRARAAALGLACGLMLGGCTGAADRAQQADSSVGSVSGTAAGKSGSTRSETTKSAAKTTDAEKTDVKKSDATKKSATESEPPSGSYRKPPEGKVATVEEFRSVVAQSLDCGEAGPFPDLPELPDLRGFACTADSGELKLYGYWGPSDGGKEESWIGSWQHLTTAVAVSGMSGKNTWVVVLTNGYDKQDDRPAELAIAKKLLTVLGGQIRDDPDAVIPG